MHGDPPAQRGIRRIGQFEQEHHSDAACEALACMPPARSRSCDSTSRQRTGVPSPILTVDTFFPSLLFPCCHVMAKLISITSRLCYSTRSAHASWPLVRIRMVYLGTPFLVSNCLFRFPLRLSTLLDRRQCRSGSCLVQVYIAFHS